MLDSFTRALQYSNFSLLLLAKSAWMRADIRAFIVHLPCVSVAKKPCELELPIRIHGAGLAHFVVNCNFSIFAEKSFPLMII